MGGYRYLKKLGWAEKYRYLKKLGLGCRKIPVPVPEKLGWAEKYRYLKKLGLGWAEKYRYRYLKNLVGPKKVPVPKKTLGQRARGKRISLRNLAPSNTDIPRL